MITLRLDPSLERSIKNTAKSLGVTKSELIRRSITEFLNNTETPSPWELGADLFGKYASGQDNLSQDRKSLLKEKIKAKRS
ncbi:MAG: ribbon-helix-helix domain-containing protein [Methylococcaceae bacterium]|nr:ribbon-helix-helix domain-containing protein [Methylococcaceae bacterium]